MIVKKSPQEVELMRAGGKITAQVLQKILATARPGVTLLELEGLAVKETSRLGASPAFKRVEGYQFATCLNVNEGIVHGIPTKRVLVDGDLLSVDFGVYYKGFNTDASWTVYVGDERNAPAKKLRLLRAGELALDRAIGQARAGNHIRDISAAMQEVLERDGYAPVNSLVGHGVGKDLHEDPQIPCLVIGGKGPEIVEGMTLAIEVIYTEGNPELEVADDGWTIRTCDGSLSGLFEHSIAVTKDGPIILTKSG